MNIVAAIGKFFSKFGKVIWGALEQAGIKGLSDELVDVAKAWVKVAAQQQLDNTQKREFVVKAVAAKFPAIPESIIRLAVELAVQAVKKELEKI